MMNGVFGSIVPPVGSARHGHVQSKEQTLEVDIHRHSKLAKKELKAANKAESNAAKERSRMEKAMRKGDIDGAERHGTLETTFKEEARAHKDRALREEEALGESQYELQTAKLSGKVGIANCMDGTPAVLTASTYNFYRPGGYGGYSGRY